MSPELDTIAKIHWQLFCTLTFKGENMPESVRYKILFAWLRAVAHDCRVPFRKLIWCSRLEAGEVGGRLHFHALLAGLPDGIPDDTAARFHVGSLWAKKGGGFSQVWPYAARSNMCSYILKPERADKTAHEARKFGDIAATVMLSKSCARVVAPRPIHRGDAISTLDNGAQ